MQFSVGQFATDTEDRELNDVGIIVFDHAVNGMDGLYSLRRLSDQHLSLRSAEELRHVDPFDAAIAFGKSAIEMSPDVIKRMRCLSPVRKDNLPVPLVEGTAISGGLAPSPDRPKPKITPHGQGKRS
jgi:hypothetical protein